MSGRRGRGIPGKARRRRSRSPRPSRTVRPRPAEWASYDDERLLDVRLCDLDLTVEHSGLEDRIGELSSELAARGLSFRPHFWLSSEWFCPDGVPGTAIPFYLAHPRLARLEQAQCYEVEGGTREWCLKILRHEAGHAIENAYRLRTLRRRRDVFGPTSTPYPRFYLPKPYSRSYVVHLDNWYAQSHPDEDFAETFAVWLTPDSNWRERYAGWPALRKLEFLDGLMVSLAGQRPLVRTTRTVAPLHQLTRTLRAHYRAKRRFYGLDRPRVYDEDLRRLFADGQDAPGAASAATFISRVRGDVRRRVAKATGEYQYTIDRVLRYIIQRCRELDLRVHRPEDDARIDFAVMLTAQTMNYLASGRHRVAL